MAGKPYKKPSVEKIREALNATGGNLSEVARTFGLNRKTIRRWCNTDQEFGDALYEARMRAFDKALSTAQILAFGVPITENGKFVGWRERPDPHMVRYLISTLGRDEGFVEEVTVNHTVAGKGLDVRKWIELEMTADSHQAENGEDET